MKTTIIGIIGNALYIAPLYGGDNYHESTISNEEKEDLVKIGIKEYSSIDYIEAYCHGVDYEEYLKYFEEGPIHIEDSLNIEDDTLPF